MSWIRSGLSLRSPRCRVAFLVDGSQPLALRVKASSPEGVRLEVRWVSSAGQFSTGGDWMPMYFDATERNWQANSIWSAPPAGVAGTDYSIEVEVRDQYGNLSAASSNSRLQVRDDKLSLHRRLCQRQRFGSGGCDR